MRILVTGGAGFIGSHVAERLVTAGHDVTIIDSLNDFYSPEKKLENIAAIVKSGTVRFHAADICDGEVVDRIFTSARPEAVIHLAARAGVRPSLEDPLLYEHVNIRGTLVLLEACRRAAVRKLVFASSSSVYGACSRLPFREDDEIRHPVSPYAATKLSGELMCYTYSHLYNLNVVCLRFFTVFGPRQRPDLAIHKFTQLIERGELVPIYGNGTTARDYTYVSDIVDGVVSALDLNCRYEVINLGSSTPIGLLDMVRCLEQTMSRDAQICWLPEQPGDVPVTFADTTKASRLLNYSPKTSFHEGILHFWNWYQQTAQKECLIAADSNSTAAFS
jgi:UDP-glucuronate 4-epimerase